MIFIYLFLKHGIANISKENKDAVYYNKNRRNKYIQSVSERTLQFSRDDPSRIEHGISLNQNKIDQTNALQARK